MMSQVYVRQREIHMLTWVDIDKRVTTGTQIELKGELGLWTVVNIYSTNRDVTLNRNWHVGGL